MLQSTVSRAWIIPERHDCAIAASTRARERHINFEHINFLKVGTTLGQPAVEPEGEVYISCVSRRTHKLFGPVNPGTTTRLSQGHLDVNQTKKFMSMCLFSPGSLAVRIIDCGSVLRCSQCFKSSLRSVIVVVPYMRTPLATTWSGSKSSLNRSPHQKPCKPRAPLNLQKVKIHPMNLGGCARQDLCFTERSLSESSHPKN